MHIGGVWILLIFSLLAAASMLLLLHLTRLGHIVHQRIPDRPRRTLFLAFVSFTITFVGVRLLVESITHHVGPFGWVMVGTPHPSPRLGHFATPGCRLLHACRSRDGKITDLDLHQPSTLHLLRNRRGLTPDEFALWLNLQDVYWAKQGRESIDAVILFGAILAASAWGAPLFTRSHNGD